MIQPVSGIRVTHTRTPQESKDLEVLIESAQRREVIRTYYREGFRRGLMWGLGVSSLFITGMILLVWWLS